MMVTGTRAYVLFGLFAFLACKEVMLFGDAFSLTTISRSRQRHHGRSSRVQLQRQLQPNLQPNTRLYQSSNNNNDNNPADAIGGDLVTALAKLDKQWKLANSSSNGKKKIGEWTVMDLKQDDSTTPEIIYLLEPSSGAAPSCVIFF